MWFDAGPPLAAGDRRHLLLGPEPQRRITALRVGSEIFAVDRVCYHAGGDLGVGDIEDLAGSGSSSSSSSSEPCLVCPDHNYKISLRTGERVLAVKNVPALPAHLVGLVELPAAGAGWRRSGSVVQRVHEARESSDAAGGARRLQIRLNAGAGPVQSDRYACAAWERGDAIAAAAGTGGASADPSVGRLGAPLPPPPAAQCAGTTGTAAAADKSAVAALGISAAGSLSCSDSDSDVVGAAAAAAAAQSVLGDDY